MCNLVENKSHKILQPCLQVPVYEVPTAGDILSVCPFVTKSVGNIYIYIYIYIYMCVCVCVCVCVFMCVLEEYFIFNKMSLSELNDSEIMNR